MEQLTIIVPVYNVEKYLEECLESIRNQTFTDFKVLMFNDGSTDNSPDILKRYQDLDKRFIFIDKKNEGYGATCNRGLDMAETEWVAIVEPDDFIAADMYEGLLSAERDEAERKPDIVKGSYWEYYEPAEGYKDALRTPNLAKFAPKRRKISTIEGNIQLLIHHPSIWSSIYRKSFLTKNNLRFVEAKGAGWVDNPFYFAALNLAKKILWVPKQYYYYRMTNAGASRYLKDFHLPFDRLREMWAFSKKHHISRQATGVLYARSLDYIDQVINRYGFDEADPDVLHLIHEVIDPMDETIVFSDPAILPRFRTYYMDFKGGSENTVSRHVSGKAPRLSLVVTVHDHRELITPFIKSLMPELSFPAEVIIVDCDSHDRTYKVIQHLSKTDQRIKPLHLNTKNLSEGLQAGLKKAVGDYVILLDVTTSSHFGEIPRILDIAEKHACNLIEFGVRASFSEDLLQKVGTAEVTAIGSDNSVFKADAKAVEGIFLSLRPNNLGNTIYARRFLVDNALVVGPDDGTSEVELKQKAFRVLLKKNTSLLLSTRSIRGEEKELAVTIPFYRQNLYTMDDHSPDLTLPSALAVFDEISSDPHLQNQILSARRMVVGSFSADVHSRLTARSLEKLVDTYFNQVEGALKEVSAKDIDISGPYNEFERLHRNGKAFFYQYLYIRTLDLLKREKSRNQGILRSTRYQVGEKVISIGKMLTPRRLLVKIYRSVTARLR